MTYGSMWFVGAFDFSVRRCKLLEPLDPKAEPSSFVIVRCRTSEDEGFRCRRDLLFDSMEDARKFADRAKADAATDTDV